MKDSVVFDNGIPNEKSHQPELLYTGSPLQTVSIAELHKYNCLREKFL